MQNKLSMNWYFQVLSKYAKFNGRARRSEYWSFALVNFFISIEIFIIDAVIGSFGMLGFLYSIAIIIPAIAVSVRRLHDTGHSGWNLLLAFIPIIGAIIILIYMVQDSISENEYGISSKLMITTFSSIALFFVYRYFRT